MGGRGEQYIRVVPTPQPRGPITWSARGRQQVEVPSAFPIVRHRDWGGKRYYYYGFLYKTPL